MKNDWRIELYEGELDGFEFVPRNFVTTTDENGEVCDHVHCYFCWKKITDLDVKEQHDTRGLVTVKDGLKLWLCARCFLDFRNRFGFRLNKGG